MAFGCFDLAIFQPHEIAFSLPVKLAFHGPLPRRKLTPRRFDPLVATCWLSTPYTTISLKQPHGLELDRDAMVLNRSRQLQRQQAFWSHSAHNCPRCHQTLGGPSPASDGKDPFCDYMLNRWARHNLRARRPVNRTGARPYQARA